MIVIDVGCARWDRGYSIERLLAMFRPRQVIGYDPYWENEMMPQSTPGAVVIWKEAAWTFDGEIGFTGSGSIGHATDDPEAPKVRCVDLARVIEGLPEGPVVLKLDAEGGEYDLLEHVISTGAAARLTRLLVEWHPTGQGMRRREIEKGLRIMDVPTEQWRW